MTPELPADHKPGMRVPKGGSCCANCEYFKGNMTCGNDYFVRWNGSAKIPAPSATEYCSDWYEPAPRKNAMAERVTSLERSRIARAQ